MEEGMNGQPTSILGRLPEDAQDTVIALVSSLNEMTFLLLNYPKLIPLQNEIVMLLSRTLEHWVEDRE